MKIYFATSIRGSAVNDVDNKGIIEHLRKYGDVLTEHFSDLKDEGETELNDKEIHDRDLNWIDECDAIVAEVTNPSLGVGYELRYGLENGKRILCVKKNNGKKLSAMISGCDYFEIDEYGSLNELEAVFSDFFEIR